MRIAQRTQYYDQAVDSGTKRVLSGVKGFVFVEFRAACALTASLLTTSMFAVRLYTQIAVLTYMVSSVDF